MNLFESIIIEIFLVFSAFFSSFKIKNPFLNMVLQIIYLSFVSIVPSSIIYILISFINRNRGINIEKVQFALLILMSIVILCIVINNFNAKRTPSNYIFIGIILFVILFNNRRSINILKWTAILRGIFFIICWLGILYSLLCLATGGLYITVTNKIGMPFVCISFLLTYYLFTYTTFEKNKHLNRKVMMEAFILLTWVVLSLCQIINYFQNNNASFLDVSLILLGFILTFSAISNLINYFSTQIWKKIKHKFFACM